MNPQDNLATQKPMNSGVVNLTTTSNHWFKSSFNLVTRSLNHFFHKAVDWLIPAKCLLCSLHLRGRSKKANIENIAGNYDLRPTIHRSLCQHCIDSLPTISTACSVCNTPLNSGELCGVCIKQPRHWDRCHAAFEYKGAIKRLITDFKYHNNPALGKILSALLYLHMLDQYTFNQHTLDQFNHNAGDETMPDYLIAVPMHPKPLQSRGFNQSHILCKALSQSLNIPMIDLINKVKKTPAQKGLSANERKKSLRNSFQLNPRQSTQTNTINKIAIIDDVMTTGSTATEISKLLKKSGISVVEIWVLART